jgi:hypothetical protein
LETVADAQDWAAIGYKRGELLTKAMNQINGEQFARAQVIAIREPAGNNEQAVIAEADAPFSQAVDMNPFGNCPGQLTRSGGIGVAIDAGRP